MKQIENPYRVKTVIAASGERLPMLLRRVDGLPLFDPTVYALTQIRGRSLAAASIERHLRAITHLELFAEIEGIDLEDRVRTGRLFSPNELDALVAAAGRPVERLVARLSNRQRPPPAPRPPPRPTRSSAPAPLERYRGRLKPNPFQPVDTDTVATRLRSIRDHVKWRAERRIGQLTDRQEVVSRREGLKAFIEGIDARMPSAGGRDPQDLPKGPSDTQMNRLLAIVETDAPDNPWADPKVRIRNRLMQRDNYDGRLATIKLSELSGHRVAI